MGAKKKSNYAAENKTEKKDEGRETEGDDAEQRCPRRVGMRVAVGVGMSWG